MSAIRKATKVVMASLMTRNKPARRGCGTIAPPSPTWAQQYLRNARLSQGKINTPLACMVRCTRADSLRRATYRIESSNLDVDIKVSGTF